jgi:hypothetical protein
MRMLACTTPCRNAFLGAMTLGHAIVADAP